MRPGIRKKDIFDVLVLSDRSTLGPLVLSGRVTWVISTSGDIMMVGLDVCGVVPCVIFSSGDSMLVGLAVCGGVVHVISTSSGLAVCGGMSANMINK